MFKIKTILKFTIYYIFSRWKLILFTAGLALTVILLSFLGLDLFNFDLKVPLNYWGDTLVMLTYIKGILQDGWPTVISHLSAPFSFSGAAFPLATSFDWLIIKIMSIFTSEIGYLINGFWLLTLVFSAWSAAYSSYQLGLSKIIAFASGIIYAFLPYAFIRNISHINLVYYLVPFLCLLAIIIAGKGKGIRNVKQATIIGIIACVLQGFNYVYFSFFAVLLFGLAMLIAYERGCGFKFIKLPLLAIAIIILSFFINLIPTFHTWSKDGMPTGMGYKCVAESEIYGAKLRKMLMPHPENPIPILAKIAQKDALSGFPNENENTTARQGLYGALGLILMFFSFLRWGSKYRIRPPIQFINSLGLVTFLVITVGGFGALINLLSVPDIRAYNRFSVFLSFFAIVTTGFWFQNILRKLKTYWRIIGYFLVGCLIILSLYDQFLDGRRVMVSRFDVEIQRVNKDRDVVQKMETIFKPESKILMMPFGSFPISQIFNKMESYDHLKPFIWSNHIKWSYPSFSEKHQYWEKKMAKLEGADFIKAAIFSGFDGIWIDRNAYLFDEIDLLESSLKIGFVKKIDIESDHVTVLDLRDEALFVKANMTNETFHNEELKMFNEGVVLLWGKGFFCEENNPYWGKYRWSENGSSFTLDNKSGSLQSISFSFYIASLNEGIVEISSSDINKKIYISTTPQLVEFTFIIKAHDKRTVNFYTNMHKIFSQNDNRNMFFYVSNIKIK